MCLGVYVSCAFSLAIFLLSAFLFLSWFVYILSYCYFSDVHLCSGGGEGGFCGWGSRDNLRVQGGETVMRAYHV